MTTPRTGRLRTFVSTYPGAVLAGVGVFLALAPLYFFTFGPGHTTHREAMGRLRADQFIEANLNSGNFITLEDSDLVASEFEDPDQPSASSMREVARLRVEGYEYRELRAILVEKDAAAHDALEAAQADGKFVWPVGSIILFIDPKLLQGTWTGTNTLANQLDGSVEYTKGGAWPASGVVNLRTESQDKIDNGDLTSGEGG